MSASLLHRRMPRPRKVRQQARFNNPVSPCHPQLIRLNLTLLLYHWGAQITLAVVLGMAFTNSVLLIVTLVRPVSQFSSSGTLMTISARGNATLGRSEDIGDGRIDDGSADEDLRNDTIGVEELPLLARRRTFNDNDRNEGQSWLIDEEDHTAPKGGKGVEKAKTTHLDNEDQHQTNDDVDGNGMFLISEGEEWEGTHTKHLKPARTYTSSMSVPLFQPGMGQLSKETSGPSMATSVTSLTASASDTLLPQIGTERLNAGYRPEGFVEIWIGPLGVCIARG